MAKQITIQVGCHVCGKPVTRKTSTESLRKNGNYVGIVYCKEHSIEKTRQYRGRTMEEMEKISKERVPEVKILSPAEINEVEHLCVPPSEKKKNIRYLRID